MKTKISTKVTTKTITVKGEDFVLESKPIKTKFTQRIKKEPAPPVGYRYTYVCFCKTPGSIAEEITFVAKNDEEARVIIGVGFVCGPI
jgi:hypothetical protein